MELKKLKVEDLVKSIEYVSQIFSSSDSMSTFMQSPIHIMIYNEMSKFSKKELESVTSQRGEKDHLYYKVLHSRNPLLFAVFLEKDVFLNKLNPEAKWLFKNIDHSPTLYETVFDAQRNRGEGKDLRNFMYYISRNLKVLDETKQAELADKVYALHGKKDERELIKYIYSNISSDSNEVFTNRVLERYKQDNIDINKYNFLNDIIHESSNRSEYSNFFISSGDFPRINKLLEKGFKFEDEKFDHHGESLFVAVLKSKRIDIINAVLPSLKMPVPRNMTMEEQHKIVDMYKTEKTYSTIKEMYYAKYYEYLADKLPEKDTKDIPKMKI